MNEKNLGWRVAGWLFGILQALAVGLLFIILGQIAELRVDINAISNRVSIIEGMHTMRGYPMLNSKNEKSSKQYDPP